MRLSALGKTRCPRIKVHTGVIIRTTDGSEAVRVLLDSRNAPVTIHSSYLDLKPSGRLGCRRASSPMASKDG